MLALNALEDALALELQSKEDAIRVLTIITSGATSGVREYIFYAKESVSLNGRLARVAARFEHYQLTISAAKDADWLMRNLDNRAIALDSEKGWRPVSYTHLDVYKRQSFLGWPQG